MASSELRKNVQSGAPWESKYGYSRAVRVGQTVAVSGTAARNPGNAYEQTREILMIIKGSLKQAGASLENVFRTRLFIINIERDSENIGRAHAEVFSSIRPVTTMVQVQRLIEPWMLVEIEADAIISK